jgi:hypothetical protein
MPILHRSSRFLVVFFIAIAGLILLTTADSIHHQTFAQIEYIAEPFARESDSKIAPSGPGFCDLGGASPIEVEAGRHDDWTFNIEGSLRCNKSRQPNRGYCHRRLREHNRDRYRSVKWRGHRRCKFHFGDYSAGRRRPRHPRQYCPRFDKTK